MIFFNSYFVFSENLETEKRGLKKTEVDPMTWIIKGKMTEDLIRIANVLLL